MPIKVISPYGHQIKTDVNKLDADVREIMGVKGDAPDVYILDNNKEVADIRQRLSPKQNLLTEGNGKKKYNSFYSPKGKAIYISNEEYQELGDKLIRHELSHHYDLMFNKEEVPKEEREKRTREAEFGQSDVMKGMKNMFKMFRSD